MKPHGNLIKILLLFCFLIGNITGFAKTVDPSIAQQDSKVFCIDSDIILYDDKTADQLEDLINKIDLPNSAESGILTKGADGRLKVGGSGSGDGRHSNWIEITDIATKVESRLSYVDYLDFRGKGFKVCHTQNAMDQFLVNSLGWTGGFIDGSGNPVSLLDNAPIEAYPWVKDVNGNLFTKTNGAQTTINGVQYGKASFFPKNWNTAKLKAEVELAIANNQGLISGNTYKGFSIDGTVEIWFYYNISNGSIISFLPKVN